MWKLSLIALLLVGCTKATPAESPATGSDKAGFAPPPPKAKATIELTAVTLADDCGGAAPTTPPKPIPAAKKQAQPGGMPAPSAIEPPGVVHENRRCEQTSMQLVVVANSDTDVAIKSVTVFDETGNEIGTLPATKPTHWSPASSTYETWDEKVPAGQTAQVSYVLTSPSFVNRYGYQNKTYTVKVVASLGGVDQPLQATAMVVAVPPPVPT
ncbi:MAG TPA: hypothetical protein VGM39_10495 [Kofleriaceae bacterium]